METVISDTRRADVTAASIFQAMLTVPGRVIPNDPEVENDEKGKKKRWPSRCRSPTLPGSRKRIVEGGRHR